MFIPQPSKDEYLSQSQSQPELPYMVNLESEYGQQHTQLGFTDHPTPSTFQQPPHSNIEEFLMGTFSEPFKVQGSDDFWGAVSIIFNLVTSISDCFYYYYY
jgi:hypothetical protein